MNSEACTPENPDSSTTKSDMSHLSREAVEARLLQHRILNILLLAYMMRAGVDFSTDVRIWVANELLDMDQTEMVNLHQRIERVMSYDD